jgi:hypothetical protein
MLKLIIKSNIHKKEDFYKEYSKNPLYKKLIIKLRRLENKFYRDIEDIHRFKTRCFYNDFQPRMLENYQLFHNDIIQYLKMLKDDYETELLKLQFRTLIDIYSKFGHESYKKVAKNYEYIVKLNEDIFKIKLHTF